MLAAAEEVAAAEEATAPPPPAMPLPGAMPAMPTVPAAGAENQDAQRPSAAANGNAPRLGLMAKTVLEHLGGRLAAAAKQADGVLQGESGV